VLIKQVRRYLVMKGYDHHETALYLQAFDFFCQNPTEFDGATIVKDLVDLNGLDLDAMLHDFQYTKLTVLRVFTFINLQVGNLLINYRS
jgi:hypothetical protein